VTKHISRWTAFLAVILFLMSSAGQAASFTVQGPHRKVLVMNGPIESGDVEKMMLAAKKDLTIASLAINSPGGSVAEAVRLAEIIKTLHWQVTVESEGVCASACFLMFYAGVGRSASAAEDITSEGRNRRREIERALGGKLPAIDGYVGVHRPYFDLAQPGSAQIDLMKRLTSYMEDRLVPRKIIDEMMARPSNDVYVLSLADLRLLGEYTADLEELFVEKCGYIKNIDVRMGQLLEQGRKKEANKMAASLISRETHTCINSLIRQKSAIGQKKILDGWTPHLPKHCSKGKV
jgi:hypothetical protein